MLQGSISLRASVKVFDNSVYRLKRLQNNIGHRLWTSVIEPRMLSKQLKTCEVAVGALGSETGRTPMVVTEEMVSNMRPGSVVIDVSIDRGGCFETSEITSHEHPIFFKIRSDTLLCAQYSIRFCTDSITGHQQCFDAFVTGSRGGGWF